MIARQTFFPSTVNTYWSTQVAAAAASASAASSAADESAKLEKLKNVYQKLRQDHITLLRWLSKHIDLARDLPVKDLSLISDGSNSH